MLRQAEAGGGIAGRGGRRDRSKEERGRRRKDRQPRPHRRDAQPPSPVEYQASVAVKMTTPTATSAAQTNSMDDITAFLLIGSR